MTPIQLTVTVDQANLILEGLGGLPFVRVYELIAALQEQARSQVGGRVPAATPTLVTGDAGGA